jgi:CheY-like chemotaxis protein
MTEPAKILVVDDNSTSRMKMRMAVRNLGHVAQVAENGAVALQMLRDDPFDAVLLDIVMPEVDGYGVLQALKADEDLRDIPVIVISSLDDEMDSVVKAIGLGAEDFLPKNFDPMLLKARLGSSLARKRFRDQERDYIKRVGRLTEAAQVLEAGSFTPQELFIDDIADRDDALGRLAAVFRAMAQDIYERERRLSRSVLMLKGTLLVLATGAVWGLTPALSRVAATAGAHPLGLAVWVNGLAALMCLVVVAFRGGMPRPTLSQLGFFALWALIAGVAHRLTTFVVAGHVEATMISLISSLQGFMVFALAAAISLERASVRRLTGHGIGFLAVTGVVLTHSVNATGARLDVWLLMAVLLPLLLALQKILLAKRRPKGIDVFASVGLMLALSTVMLFPAALASDSLLALSLSPGTLELTVLVLAAATAGAVLLAVQLVESAGAVFASQAAYAMAFGGIVWGMLLLGEGLSPLAWGALALILVGLYLVEPRSEGQFRHSLSLKGKRKATTVQHEQVGQAGN